MADAARAWGFRGSVRRRSPSATGSPSCPRRTEPRSGLPGWRTWGEGRFPGRRGPRAGDLAPACHGPGEAPRDRVPEAAGDGEVDETAEGDGRRKGGPFGRRPRAGDLPAARVSDREAGRHIVPAAPGGQAGPGPQEAAGFVLRMRRRHGRGPLGKVREIQVGRRGARAGESGRAPPGAASRKKGRCVQEMQRGRTRANEAEAPGPYAERMRTGCSALGSGCATRLGAPARWFRGAFRLGAAAGRAGPRQPAGRNRRGGSVRSACGAEPLLSRLGAKRRAKRSARRAWPRSRRGCARDARGPTRVWPSPDCVVTVPTPPAMLVLGRARGFPVLSRGPEGQLRMGRANRWLLHRVDPEDWRPARIAHSAPQRQFR